MKTISFTIPEELFARLERLRRRKRLERSRVIQRALELYLGLHGPDPRVLSRWGEVYDRLGAEEADAAERWVGEPGGSPEGP